MSDWAVSPRQRRRKAVDAIMTIVCLVAAVAALVILTQILWTLVERGTEGLSLRLFTEPMAAPGSNGGLRNAIVGTLFQVAFAILLAAPFGIMVGVYMAEYGRRSKAANAVRAVNDMLLSAPSVLIGLFVYQMVVRPTGGFSGYAGGIALAIVALPIIARATEDMLSLVPDPLRDGSDALGARRYQTVFRVVLPAAASGIITAILLAIARIAGETAPLIFTSFGSNAAELDPSGPTASIPLAIYQYASSPAPDWVALAWAGALVITSGVLVLNVLSRLVQSRLAARRGGRR